MASQEQVTILPVDRSNSYGATPQETGQNAATRKTPATSRETGTTSGQNAATRKTRYLFILMIRALLLVVVLSFTVLSKLSLISMTSRLKAALAREEQGAAVSLYWQLLLVIMVPQCVTFVRTMLRGVCGKRTATFPWPTIRALLVVSRMGCINIKIANTGAGEGGPFV